MQEAADTIRHHLYVDDYLDSAPSLEKAIRRASGVEPLLAADEPFSLPDLIIVTSKIKLR